MTSDNATDSFFEELLSSPDTAATTVLPTHKVEKSVKVPESIQPSDDSDLEGELFAKLGVDFNMAETETRAIPRVGRPRAGLMWGIGSAAGVLLVGLVAWVLTLGSLNINITPGQGGIAVADVVNQSYDSAYNTLTGQNLLVLKTYQNSDTVPADTVISTDPIAGTKVAENTTITVYVSSGSQLTMVPNLLGMTEQQATDALTAAKLNLGTITQGQSATYPAGQVISSDPLANTQIAPGTTINLVISNGKVMVPNVRNLSINDAKAQLSAPDIGLIVSIQTRNACSGTQGTIVLEQSLPAGLVAQKSAIILYVACN